MVVAPGAYDAVAARTIAQAGFPAVYMTGAGTSASLGYPDFGLVTMTEMVANAARIARSVDVPVIADADTGYGNELNVVRTVQEYEARRRRRHPIEDQVSRRDAAISTTRRSCRARNGSPRSAPPPPPAATRTSSIIARTDSRAVAGFDEAIARANLALAGRRRHGLRRGAADARGNRRGAETGQGPVPAERRPRRQDAGDRLGEAERIGYKLAIVPGLLLKAVVGACDAALAELKAPARIRPLGD